MSMAMIRRMKSIKFIDCVRTGIKCGINSQNPPSIGEIGQTIKSGCLLSNNTAVADIFKTQTNKFDSMYAKRAFVHWHVGEGMSEGEH